MDADHHLFANHALTPARSTVRLLEVDPDLALGLDAAELERARPRSRVMSVQLDGPDWDPAPIVAASQPGWLGLFVVDGLLVRSVSVGTRSACELLGPGDIFRPWDSDGNFDPVKVELGWRVPVPTRIALLDGGLTQRLAPWPPINSQLMARVAGRARSLGLYRAISHFPRAESRLLILFWLLADRWGRVGPDGITITLPLTHDLLSSLIGVRRPTVSLSLQRLNQAGLLTRPRRNRWVLAHEAADHLEDPESLNLLAAVGVGVEEISAS